VVVAFKIFNHILTQPSSNRTKLRGVTGKTRTELSGLEENKPVSFEISESAAKSASDRRTSGFHAFGIIIWQATGRLAGKSGASISPWD